MAFALKLVSEIAARRRNYRALVMCHELGREKGTISLESDGAVRHLRMVTHGVDAIASDLLAAIKFEMREILIPFLEVKGPTHEFGVEMFPDYFQWLPDDRSCTAEELVKILEDDTDKLLIVKEYTAKSRRLA